MKLVIWPHAVRLRRWEGQVFIKQRIANVEWAEDHENLFDDRAFRRIGPYFLSAIIFGVS
jgi:hypothetical protein